MFFKDREVFPTMKSVIITFLSVWAGLSVVVVWLTDFTEIQNLGIVFGLYLAVFFVIDRILARDLIVNYKELHKSTKELIKSNKELLKNIERL